MDLDTSAQIVLQSALRRFTKKDLALALGTVPRTVIRWGNGENMALQYKLAIMFLLSKRNSPAAHRADFTFVDLFAGIGGMRAGFQSAGGRCVFTSEIDESCQFSYRRNFGEDEEIFGDITELTRRDEIHRIPDHDVLLAGFPCQPFSLAGVSKKNSLGRQHGFACEAQGTLFFDLAKIIEKKRPLAFVLENVKNLRSHDGGNTYRTIYKILRHDLGYTFDDKLIDAKGFVPQHRERVFIVGFREDVGFSWKAFRQPPADAVRLREILHPGDGSEEPEKHYTLGSKAKVASKYTLSPKLWGYLQAYRKKHEAKGNGFGYSLFGPDDVARTLSARYHKDGSEILIKRNRANPRRLTPRECARLMGFDSPERKFEIEVSDTAAYKQFGNAVVVPVVREVARIMKPFVLQLRDGQDIGAHQPTLHLEMAEA